MKTTKINKEMKCKIIWTLESDQNTQRLEQLLNEVPASIKKLTKRRKKVSENRVYDVPNFVLHFSL